MNHTRSYAVLAALIIVLTIMVWVLDFSTYAPMVEHTYAQIWVPIILSYAIGAFHMHIQMMPSAAVVVGNDSSIISEYNAEHHVNQHTEPIHSEQKKSAVKQMSLT